MQTLRATPAALLITLASLTAASHAQTTTPAPDTLAAAAADRSASGCSPMRFSNLQRRVLTESDRGDEGLRRYLARTRMIHQLDPGETQAWVAQVRQRQRDCSTVITALAP